MRLEGVKGPQGGEEGPYYIWLGISGLILVLKRCQYAVRRPLEEAFDNGWGQE